MTAVPPERGGAYGGGYGAGGYGTGGYGEAYAGEPEEDDPEAYERTEAFQAAVDALADPLTDPIPGRPAPTGQPARAERSASGEERREKPQQGPVREQERAQETSPWFTPQQPPAQAQGAAGATGAAGSTGTPGPAAAVPQQPAPRPSDRPHPGHADGAGSAYAGGAQLPGYQGESWERDEPWDRKPWDQAVPPQQRWGQQETRVPEQGAVRQPPAQQRPAQGPAPQGPAQGPVPQGTVPQRPDAARGPGVRQQPGVGPQSGTPQGPAVQRPLVEPESGTTSELPVFSREPGVTGPDLTGPGAPGPDLTGPDLTGSGVTGPAADESGARRTGTGQAGAVGAVGAVGAEEEDEDRTVGLRRPGAAELEGRAARRRAARQRGGRGPAATPAPASSYGTRLEAMRAARAARPGPGVIASRFLGEVFITVGVVMLLFVAYQLWWTNVLAGQEAGGATQDLQDQWKHGGGSGGSSVDPARKAGKFAPGQGFAIIYIPKLDIKTPIAQGVSKPQVLDKGLVGHYDTSPFDTAMPWDKKGNFALAGHRNTHGEPFRYINRLVIGDKVVVETATKFYTYEMTNRLPATSPSNTGVIRPVPVGSGFNKPGRYITLTTCTPEFTSKYRLIVWGKMVEERPRSEGKPDALLQ